VATANQDTQAQPTWAANTMPLDQDKQKRVDELMEDMRSSMPEDEWNAITKMAKEAAERNRLRTKALDPLIAADGAIPNAVPTA